MRLEDLGQPVVAQEEDLRAHLPAGARAGAALVVDTYVQRTGHGGNQRRSSFGSTQSRQRPGRRMHAGGAPPAGPREEGLVLKEGDKAPEVTGTSCDGASFDMGAPGRRTVLWFYPKANTGG